MTRTPNAGPALEGDAPLVSDRRGFLFPLAVALVGILLVLGGMFLFFTVQAKNVSFSFLLDNLAISLAESAVAEGRLRLSQGLKTDSELQRFVATFEPGSGPTQGDFPFPFSLATLPRTTGIADRLLGKGKVQIQGVVSLHHVNRVFPPVPLGNGKCEDLRFDGEFQAILRFEFTVALAWGTQTQKSRFTFEFDFKHACLRSRPEGREVRGYPSTATHDYALFLRDAHDEFQGKRAETLNGERFRLDVAGPGKIFLGSRDLSDLDRKLFLNLPETLAGMIPAPPANLVFSWGELQQMAPKLTSSIEAGIRAGLPPNAQYKVPDVLNSFSGNLAIEYAPMMGFDQGGWLAAAQPWKKKAYGDYFARCSQAISRAPALGPESNPFPLSIRINGREYDPTALLEGNIRKRFWLTSTWWLTSTYSPKLKETIENRSLSLIERLLPEELAAKSPEVQEVHAMVASLEKKAGELLTTGPHDQFLFGEKPIKASAVGFPLPPLYQQLRTEGLNSFRPLACPFVRSYMFDHASDFFASPLYFLDEQKVPHIKLLGLVGVRDVLRIPSGTKFHGKGMLYSLQSLVIDGGFQPASPEDGPCILFCDNGRIVAHLDNDQEITASLIALNFFFPKGSSGILCPRGVLNVKGNIVADRLCFTEGTQAPEKPTGQYRITYDADRLAGKSGDLYVSFVGGLLRRVGTSMSAP